MSQANDAAWERACRSWSFGHALRAFLVWERQQTIAIPSEDTQTFAVQQTAPFLHQLLDGARLGLKTLSMPWAGAAD
jgi:hypothetical protein